MAHLGEAAEILRRSTVQVESGSGGNRSSGTGVVWETGNTIVTNAHVVPFAEVKVFAWDGSSWPAEVKQRDRAKDLARLRIPGLLHAAMPARARPRTGEMVLAVGNPMGFTGALSTGVVQAVGPVRGLGAGDWIQSALRLARGNSGGPLANTAGEIAGINAMLAGGLALSIPADRVFRFLRSPQRPRLGVTFRPLGGSRPGLLVLEVEPGGAGDRSSILAGDLLVGSGPIALRGSDDLEDALDRTRGVLHLSFLRGGSGRIREVAVQIPAAGAAAA